MAAPAGGADPGRSGEEEPQEEDDVAGDHEWHFRYNRRLQCFSHAVTNIAFSEDGQHLVSSTSLGDVKVWDTGTWAERARLRGGMRKEPRTVAISPAQRWLVSAYASVLQVFKCGPPWRLEKSLPAPLDPATKEQHEWLCVAFSPMSEVDHPGGKTGQDNHLAAFSSAALCIIDYSDGWENTGPCRSRSLMQCSKATSLAYTACGFWLICGFDNGLLQVWNAFSLTTEKTLNGHSESVTCLASSPRGAPYDSRFVSSGVDQMIRLWHSNGWILEQNVHDMSSDFSGVHMVAFSSNAKWLISVSTELTVWSICLTSRGRLVLGLHQRLRAVCGSEGLQCAAICSYGDAIAVGSKDGVLGLWTKCPGRPPDASELHTSQAGELAASKGSVPWTPTTSLARPMSRVMPQQSKPFERKVQPNAHWFSAGPLRLEAYARVGGQQELRSLSATAPLAFRASPILSRAPSGSMLYVDRSRPCSSESGGVLAGAGALPARRLEHSATVPDLAGKEFSRWGSSDYSQVRKSMHHACSRGLVKRIALDPKVITDN